MSRNDTLAPAVLTYEKAYRNELFTLNSMDAIQKHKSAAMKLSRRNFSSDEDPIIALLTAYIILATPDFIKLDEPKKAEERQTAYAGLLYR